MKQWKGLLVKEWTSMKWTIIILALFEAVIISFFPYFIVKIFIPNMDVFEITLVFSFFCTLSVMFVPVISLFIMLEREMKRPDVWLHSTASVFKLIGVKVFAAIVIGIVGFLIPISILAIQFFISDSTTITFHELLYFGSAFILAFFLSSISMMCTGLFFWVLYRLMKPFVKGFAIPITLLLFFLLAFISTRIVLSDWYERIVMVGPIKIANISNVNYQSEFVFFNSDQPFYFTGQFVVDIILTILMFVTAVLLFEKKVRL